MKRLAYSCIILTIVFAISALIGIASIFVAFNNDDLFKSLGNFFLADQNFVIKESQGVSLSPLAFSFDNLVLSMNNIQINIEEGQLISAFLSEEREENLLTLKSLTLHLNGSNQSNRTSLIDYSSILPSTLADQLKGNNIYISRLKINAPTILKKGLFFKDMKIKNVSEGLIGEIFFNDAHSQSSPKIEITFDQKNHLDLKVELNKEEHLQLSSVMKIEGDKLNLSLKGKLRFANQATNYLKTHLNNSENIQTIRSNISFESKHLLNQDLNTQIEEQALTLINFLSMNNQTTIQFRNEIIHSLQLKTRFRTKTDQSSTLFISMDDYALNIDFNKNNPFCDSYQNLKFLCEMTLKIRPGDISKTYIFPDKVLAEDLNISWSEQQDPAYLDLNIDNFLLNANGLPNWNVRLNYSFNGRWNRKLLSRHKGELKLLKNHSQINGDIQIDDNSLHTSLSSKFTVIDGLPTGTFSLTTKDFQFSPLRLNRFISNWQPDLKLISGEILNTGTYTFYQTTKQDWEIKHTLKSWIKDLSVDFDGYIIKKINARPSFVGFNDSFYTPKAFDIEIKEVDTGTLVENISLESSVQINLSSYSKLKFFDLSGELLEGGFESRYFYIELPPALEGEQQKYSGSLNISMRDLQLKEILKLTDNPEIQGDGLLYGQLPIYLDQDNTLIQNGWIKNQNKGRIQYTPNKEIQKSLKKDQEMELLLSILQQLDYHELISEVELDAKGMMRLKTHIEGKNSNFQEGFPIIFNPDISLDFTDMMKSLRISDDISKTLSEKITEKNLD